MPSKLYDVLIIGGGPAGLSLATSLARQAYTALILDSGHYRNAVSKHMHTVPGFDHQDPAVFRAKVRADLQSRYANIEYKSGTVVKQVKQVKQIDGGSGERGERGGFEAVDEDGVVYRATKLGLATGVRDLLDREVPGFAEAWGRGVFHCLFCHGYEERGAASAGVLASGMLVVPEAVSHVAKMAKNLSQGVTIYTSGRAELAGLSSSFGSSKIRIDDRVVKSLTLVSGGPEVQVNFEDGSSKTEGFLVGHPNIEQRAPFAQQLGLEMGTIQDIKVSAPFNETSVKGCYAAGDAATPMRSALQAIHTGSFAAVGMTMALQAEADARDDL